MVAWGARWMAVVCAALAGPAAWGQDGGESVTRFLRIVEQPSAEKGGIGRATAQGQALRMRGVEIDATLRMQWDESGLLSYMAKLVSPNVKVLSQRHGPGIADLQAAAHLIAEAQGRELRYRTAMLKQLSGPVSAKGQFQAQGLIELAQFRADAIADLSDRKGIGSKFLKDLASSLSGNTDDGFASLREACGDIVRGIRAQIDESVAGAPIVNLYLSAHLVTPIGKPYQIHLAGYDGLQVGDPKPFARNRMVLDDRTREELLAAEQVLAALRQAREIDLTRAARDSQVAVSTAFASLSRRLRVEELDRECDRLATALREVGEARVGPILRDVRALQAVVRPVSRHKMMAAPTQAQALGLFADLLTNMSGDLWEFVRSAPRLLGSIATGLAEYAKASPGVVGADSLEFFRSVKEEFVSNFDDISGETERVTSTINATSRALRLTEDFTMVAQELVGKAIGAGDPLDTALDMRTIPASRRPGDRVVVRAQIKRADPALKASDTGREVLLEEGTVTLYVEAFGGYWQSGGSLLFVDPRSTIGRSLSYEPTVGLGLHYHYGVRGSNYWNRVVNPGLGVTFSMLDFNDDQRFEVGAAVGVTLFSDQL